MQVSITVSHPFRLQQSVSTKHVPPLVWQTLSQDALCSLQCRPGQHRVALLQKAPKLLHALVPLQSPAVQVPEQHWLADVQDVPFCWHVLLPHVPPVQTLLQQSDAWRHVMPAALQAPHEPPMHVMLQHSDAVAHVAPPALHDDLPHIPIWQMALQQSLVFVHGMPSSAHVAPGAHL
jgi:hypothetical protein